jgi:hypothetical protein
MPSKITVHPVYSSKKEAEIVKLCKYHFVDRLNFSGVQYNAIHFVSSLLNEAIKRFDTKQSVQVILPVECKPQHFDIATIEKHVNEFLHHLRESKVSMILFEHIEHLLKSAISVLEESFSTAIKS